MAHLFYVHWNESEARDHVALLAAAGHAVTAHFTSGGEIKLGDLPDAFVISLDRLPSHGAQVAQWIWKAKKRQSIPIVFIGGEAEKAAAVMAKFPVARHYAGIAEFLAAPGKSAA